MITPIEMATQCCGSATNQIAQHSLLVCCNTVTGNISSTMLSEDISHFGPML
jgi:hypothetical protein